MLWVSARCISPLGRLLCDRKHFCSWGGSRRSCLWLGMLQSKPMVCSTKGQMLYVIAQCLSKFCVPQRCSPEHM